MMEMSAEATIAIMENILEHDKKINIPTRNAMENAVRLLKESERIHVKPIGSFSIKDCSKCGHLIAEGMSYCPVCGGIIDWE